MLLNIIHDESQTGRWQLLKEQLERQRIRSVCWPAVDKDIAQAHKNIIQDAKKRGLKSVFIAEDDLLIPAMDGWEYFINSVPNDTDLHLGGAYMLEGTPNKVRRFAGFHLYCLMQSGYDKFLNCDTSANSLENALSALAIKNQLRITCCYPYSAIQQELPSTNPMHKGMKFNHKNYFKSGQVYGR